MYQIYTCLVHQHDFRLVLLAALICVLSVFTEVRLMRMLALRREPYRTLWLALTACVTAIGVWATHFVAMLAFDPGVAMEYAPWPTAGSLGAAALLIFVGLWIAARPGERLAPPIGGGIIGLSIGVMHYTGMAAVRAQGDFSWNHVTIVVSLIAGAVLAASAAEAFVRGRTIRHDATAIGLMTLAICSLHFLGMGAVTIVPDSSVHIPDEAISRNVLAAAVAGSAVIILLLAVGATMLERRQKVVAERRLLELANAAVEGLAVCDDDRIVTVNAALLQLLDRPVADVVGRAFAELMPQGEGFTPSALDDEVRMEATLLTASGDAVPVELVGRAMPFNGGQRVGVAVRDLRDRIAAESKIRYLAHNDALTGLANRANFNDRLEAEFQRHRRKADSFAVLCLDLDRFKQVNDVFGHAAGDAALKAAGERISPLLDEGDVFARLGGDEFAIIRLGEPAPETLSRFAAQILTVMADEIDLGGQSAMIGASIGIAVFPQDGATPDELMRSADAALYKAKADGRGIYRFFEAELGAELRVRQAMEFDLRQAIARDELRVVYQPQNDIRTGATFGFEALVRWRCPTRGEVSPGVFIPIAEETGLIMQIGDWVLREACREAASWPNPLQIAVNLSGVQLRAPHLSARVHEILIETGLAPDRLELEITETALVDDFARALHSLRQIKALGVKVAMDDFGTGYSSLSNLRAFPFDKLKIDQTFVRNVQASDEAGAIVRAIVGLARGLNLKVLAEGVETSEELAFLDQELCTEAQGYLFGRPSAIDAFAEATGAAAPVVEMAKRRKAS